MITEYKRDLKSVLYGFIVVTLFVAIILFTSKGSIFTNLLIWFLLVCIPYFIIYAIVKKINKILIDEANGQVTFIFKKFDFKEFRSKEINENYLITELSYTYKEKMTGRMTKGYVLDVYSKNNQLLINVDLAYYNGWDKEKLIEIVAKLNQLGSENLNK